MMANEGQRRPTKTKKGPNDVSGVVWALGVFFFQFFLPFYLQQRSIAANDGHQRPTQAHESPQQPTTANEGQCRPTKAHSSHRVANDGQQRPTKTKKGPNDASGVVWAIDSDYFNCFLMY